MKQIPSIFRIHSLLLLGLVLLISARAETGAQTTVTEITLRPTRYVIDIDALNPHRDLNYIKGTVTVRYEGPRMARNTRVRMRLVDPLTGDAFPLWAGTDLAEPATFDPGALEEGEMVEQVFAYAMAPYEQLNASIPYHIEARVELAPRTTIGMWVPLAWEEGPARHFYHFTNLVSGDPEYNVIGGVEDLALARDWRIRTIKESDTFPLSFLLRMVRYDDWEEETTWDTIEFELQVRLIDNLGNVISTVLPLRPEQASFSHSFPSHFEGDPWEESHTYNLDIQPLTQLRVSDRSYRIEVELRSPSRPKAPMATLELASTTPRTLLDYSGDLRFGAGDRAFLMRMTEAERTGTLVGLIPGASYANTELVIDRVEHPFATYTYAGALGTLTVRLSNTGMASFHDTGADPFQLANESGDWQNVFFRGMRFQVGPYLYAGAAGVHTSVKIDPLPSGFGLATTPPTHDTFFNNQSSLPVVTGVFVNGSLRPVDPVRWDYNAWAFEESKPIAIRVSAITLVTGPTIQTHLELEPTGETFDPLADWYALLDNAPEDLPDRLKHANDHYYRLVTGVDATQPVIVDSDPNAGPNANARLSVTFTMGSGYLRPHFPHAELIVNGSNGRLRVTNDLIDVEASFLPHVNIYVFYNDGAPPDASGCDEDRPSMTHFAMRSIDSGRLSFTPLGGLWAECERIGPDTFDLAWGRLDEDTHAFSANGFGVATFYMPGTFHPFGAIGQESFQGGHHYAPVAASIMGYVPGEWEMHEVEWPSLPAYRDNSLRADYAGVNLRVEGEAGVFGQSFIGGEDAGTFSLKEDSRYYARKAGVTGIHDAIGGPEAVVLYGFNAVFDSYGFAFRDSVVVDSVTDGGLIVPYPSAFSLPLRNFEFTATGRPLRADLSETLDTVVLSYWNCSIRPISMTFERDAAAFCDLGSGFIKLHAEVSLPNLGESLYGDLGFAADGNLSTPDQGGVRSRLTAPNQLTFSGPQRADNGGRESYTFTPATEIYFNNHTYRSEAAPLGFINLAGSLSVAFFEDLKTHLQTTVGSGDDADAALFHIMRGWTAGGEDFFSDPRGFDPTNRGFPAGMTLADYRSGEQFRPVARRPWMSGITFEYPLDWDAATRSFRSPDDFDGSISLLILDAEHKLDYLSAELAAISFGVTFSGIPSLNPTSILVNQIDEVTGALSALQKALGNAVAGALFLGASSFSDVLNDSINGLLGDVLDEAFEALVLAQVLDPLGDPGNDDRLRPESEWNALLNQSLTDPNAWLIAYLHDLAADIDTPPLLTAVQGKLDDVLGAIDVFVDEEDGILATDSEGRYTVGARLIYALVDELMPADIKASLGIHAGGTAEQQINAQTTHYIAKYAPSLATLKGNLTRLRTQIEEVRDGLEAGNAIADFIHERFNSDEGRTELNALADILKSDVEGHLRSRYAGRAHEFGIDENREASAAFISLRVRDRLATTAIAGSVQIVFRQQLQDLQGILDQTTASVFSTINRVIEEVTSEALGAIDETISPMKGGLSGVAGSGNVTGYARIMGDRLDHLRLDATLELKLDEPFKFAGFIEINQAAAAYGEARDIQIGAFDVPIPLLDSTAYYTIIGRLVLADSGAPLGIGGSIEMTRGEITFEAFRITTLGAALMFGAQENYIAAKLGMEFQSFRLAGGIFLGRSLYIDPLEMVDPDVADMITPPFTGVYVYGEVFMPIVDFGCFFRISAGLGVGAFYFVEGPTYGGKIYAAVQGRALCLVSVKGEIVLVGVKTDIFRFKGRGRISGSVGKCPFCVKFGKSVAFTYDQRSGFDASF